MSKKSARWCVVSLFFSVLFCVPAYANNTDIMHALDKLGIKEAEIKTTRYPGIRAVISSEEVFYISADGKYLIEGKIYDISGSVPQTIDTPWVSERVNALAATQAITYKSLNERFIITVFTDFTCIFCQKMHDEMKRYNEAGITVRYLAFARAGVDSTSGKILQSIWCSTDPHTMLDDAFKAKAVPPAACKIDIVQHMALGKLIGLSGTPGIVLQDGRIITGYWPAKALLGIIEKR